LRSDALSNVLLALIAAGIFFSAALDLRGMAPTRTGDDSAAGRYRIVPLAMRQLILLDTQTGRTWRGSPRSAGWTPMEPPPEALDAEEGSEPEPGEAEKGAGPEPGAANPGAPADPTTP